MPAQAAQVDAHLQGCVTALAGSGHQGALLTPPSGPASTVSPRGLWAAEGARI